jgi:PAS domain S-box-containing protein
MPVPSKSRFSVLSASLSKGAAVLVSLLGATMLAGWVFDIALLKWTPQGMVGMKANTAFAFLLSGISLWLSAPEEEGGTRGKERIGRGLAFLVALLGLLTLSEYVFGWDLGIDQLLAREAPGALKTSSPGRMAPNTALDFLFLGGALLLLDVRRGEWIASFLALVAGTVAILALMGYAYTAESLIDFLSYTHIAIHTAVAFLVLTAGILFMYRDRGVMGIVMSDTPGGVMARRILPPVVAVPILLAWLRVMGERAGLYGHELGVALLVTASIVTLMIVVVWSATTLNTADAERRRAEEAVRQARMYNRSLLEASLDSLVAIGPDGTVTDVNAATEAITGFSREALVGTDFADYFTDPEKARAGYRQVFREGSVRDYALEVRRRDGGVTPVLYNASVYRGESGKVTGVFAAARDITELKRAEDALNRQAEELARSNAELEKFAYVASHDLQEPLRMISGFSQLLVRRYQGTLGPEADEFIGYVVDGTNRMQRLINDLLAYSRVGTRGGKFEPTDVSVALERALQNLRVTIEESGALVSRDPLPTVTADGIQLAQLFQNLIGNAVKFRGEQRPKVHVSARLDGGEWIFSVKDNGIGIDPKYFGRIFTIFQRLHGNTEYPGTGIGLAICKKIAERHGGRVWVESETGMGSTFFFSIVEKGRNNHEP